MYKILVAIVFISLFTVARAQVYPDAHFTMYIDSIYAGIEEANGLVLSSDGRSMQLADDETYGYMILQAQQAGAPFNRGLPSWNGSVSGDDSGFLVQMRFPFGNGWSPWLTAGFWKAYIWSSYGSTSYGGGEIDYDYVKLTSYQSSWQFKVHMARFSASDPTPTLHKLSFFTSDSRTTAAVDIAALVNDNPEQIYIDTDFLYQYGIDDEIGGSICSPTTTSMILRSYDIEVDPLQFAIDTRDPYYGIFGIWPRVVQNACEFGLDGAVTRYRNWSEAREVLANGGRIAMSVGLPLYSGHLFMLAGFTEQGDPIVHDPARSNGYAYVYNKTSISQSWFNKGGIAYTFYPHEDQPLAVAELLQAEFPGQFHIRQNYPNPFNPVTRIDFSLPQHGLVEISVYDIQGRKIETIFHKYLNGGWHFVMWDATAQPSGTYFISIKSGGLHKTMKAMLLK